MNAQFAAVVLRIAELIGESYVDPAAAARCAEVLKQRLEAGAFAGAKTSAEFAAVATNELRAHCGDRHFEVVVRAAPAAQPADPDAWKDDLRRRNYDFMHVERLAGNVGYLQLNSFPPPEVAGETAAAAMTFLASSDAAIIDLRLNSGGTGNMVTFLYSYLFDEPTLMTTTYRRPTNRTSENWTLAYVPGRRMAKTPLYLLTSAATFSAAEAFAAPLQAMKRAVVVGEVTRGGANPGRMRRVDDTFDVFIPIGTTKVAANDQTWDGKGITPDIATRADDAFAAAHRAAVQKLIGETKSDERRRELQWIAEWLASTPGAIDPRWEGRYGNRVISAANEHLFQSVDNGPRRRLLPAGAGTFLVEHTEHVRLRFEPPQLIVETSDGRREIIERAPSSPRTPSRSRP